MLRRFPLISSLCCLGSSGTPNRCCFSNSKLLILLMQMYLHVMTYLNACTTPLKAHCVPDPAAAPSLRSSTWILKDERLKLSFIDGLNPLRLWWFLFLLIYWLIYFFCRVVAVVYGFHNYMLWVSQKAQPKLPRLAWVECALPQSWERSQARRGILLTRHARSNWLIDHHVFTCCSLSYCICAFIARVST